VKVWENLKKLLKHSRNGSCSHSSSWSPKLSLVFLQHDRNMVFTFLKYSFCGNCALKVHVAFSSGAAEQNFGTEWRCLWQYPSGKHQSLSHLAYMISGIITFLNVHYRSLSNSCTVNSTLVIADTLGDVV